MNFIKSNSTARAGCLGLELVPHEAGKLSSFPHLWGDLDDITAIPQAAQIRPGFACIPGASRLRSP